MKLSPRLSFFSIILAGFLMSFSLQAAEIPEKILQVNYDECLKMVKMNKHLTETEMHEYCLCTKKGIGAKMTLAEYTEMSLAITLQQTVPAQTKIISEIAAQCMAESFK